MVLPKRSAFRLQKIAAVARSCLILTGLCCLWIILKWPLVILDISGVDNMPRWTEEQRARERERKRIQRAKYPEYAAYYTEYQRKRREDPAFLEMHNQREKERRTADP